MLRADRRLFVFTWLLLATPLACPAAEALVSIDTGETICLVRSAVGRDGPYIVASSYEGEVLGISYEGGVRWRRRLSGIMNHDLATGDLDDDGVDEVLAACADGTLYCLDAGGDLRWRFKRNDAPMNAVCAFKRSGRGYVACGGYDKNLYYLDALGKLVKTVPSATYSKERVWGSAQGKRLPESQQHITNLLRAVRVGEDETAIVLHAAINSMNANGSVYLFKPLANEPYHIIERSGGSPFGDLGIGDSNGDGVDELLFGTSALHPGSRAVLIDLATNNRRDLDLSSFGKQVSGFGYRVAQSVVFEDAGERKFLTAFGANLVVTPLDLNTEQCEFVSCGYSFNDLWRAPETGKLLLASAQSGGSCVHILDPSNPEWKSAFGGLRPRGKLKAVLDNTDTARKQLRRFRAPAHERPPKPVYLTSESLPGPLKQRALQLTEQHGSPVFLKSGFFSAEDWDRSSISSEKYRERRDRRKRYDLTQSQALEKIRGLYQSDLAGAAFWGGHGNDPYLFSTDTMRKAADAAGGKKSVFIYPELEDFDADFSKVLEEHIYPLAEYFRDKNAKLFLRNKHAFWQSVVYLPLWSRLVSGEFADVFVPSMEETTDKTMEQSLAGRLGLWASGAVNQWGSRCARDNASFDRLRQHSHQMVPNHFLRSQVFHTAYGATYHDNFPVDQEYFSLFYELIAKGVLYVPERREIVSFSPVHLAMKTPDRDYLEAGNNAKWVTFFDAAREEKNPMVFGRLNGSWPGAPVTEWDYSRYAAGVADRRLNFLPPFENGLVLITPVQHGVFAANRSQRGKMADHLHPLYRGLLKQIVTDGRNYYSADGGRTIPADRGYRVAENTIKAGARRLPLKVSGGVAWVAAQTSPTHLRVTLVDSGYINPDRRTATIRFHSVRPKRVRALLDREEFTISGNSTEVGVPCGLFRFLEVELTEPLAGHRDDS